MVVSDPTQQGEGDAAQWTKEPLNERHPDLLIHTERPINAEPPNSALQEMITPDRLHYRRTHAPVPDLNENSHVLKISCEDDPTNNGSSHKNFSMKDLQTQFSVLEITVSLMCTGNRRSEFNTEEDGETLGLPWKNGCDFA